MVGLVAFIPNGYPYHSSLSSSSTRKFNFPDAKTLQRIDWVGAFVLLVATILVCTAFEQAGIEFPWESAFVIAMLVVSGVLWLGFLGWEKWVTKKGGVREPVSPWRFLANRVTIGVLLFVNPSILSFMKEKDNYADDCGQELLPSRPGAHSPCIPTPATLRTHQLILHHPRRSPTPPVLLHDPLGILLGSILAGRAKIPAVYLMAVAGIMQVVGFALLSTLSGIVGVSKAQYGYQVLGGLGAGMTTGLAVILTPFVVEDRDQCERSSPHPLLFHQY